MTPPGKPRRTFEVPDGPREPRDGLPAFSFGSLDRDGRDTLRPVGFDEHGQPLYAPRGFVIRSPG